MRRIFAADNHNKVRRRILQSAWPVAGGADAALVAEGGMPGRGCLSVLSDALDINVSRTVVFGEAAVALGNHFGSRFRKMLAHLSPDLLHRQSLRRRTGKPVADRDGSGRWRFDFHGCEDAPDPCWCQWGRLARMGAFQLGSWKRRGKQGLWEPCRGCGLEGSAGAVEES
jgi:hypothetical protein